MNINDLHGEELFTYLRKNQDTLIKAKKDTLKFTDSLTCTTLVSQREPKSEATKDDSGSTSSDPEKDTLEVTIVANAANIVDSHMDMLTDDAYTESIKARGTSIPHILDHNQSAIGHVGDVTKVYTKELDLKDLGLDANGKTTALLMDSTVRKDYNEKVFKFYQSGKINQHSVGLTYGDIKLAVNSSHEDDKSMKETWDKYYPKVINKDIIDKRGYFYIVTKADIRENSAVLFGANPLTPTLSIKGETLIPDSPLENEQNVINQPSIGKYMTLDEAQGKIISLTEEVAKLKSDIALAKLEATTNEKNRVLGILKAQTTFGNELSLQKAAMTFIEKGTDVDTVVTSLEVLKESIQKSNHVGTVGATLQATQDPENLASFEAELLSGLKSMSEQPQLFKGVR